MKNTVFYKIFLQFIQDIYDAELQIVEALPLMIKESSHEELKKGLKDHLQETKQQVARLEEVFELLGEKARTKKCKGMAGIIEEGKDVLKKSGLTPAVADCFIIITAQQVEHYEIASYGSAIALVEHMQRVIPDEPNLKQITELLNANLKEEKATDKKLTKIAEGKMFIDGVNDEIEQEINVKK